MENLNKYIEHTLLKQDAAKEDFEKLFAEAREHNFLGVCVNPAYVKLAKEALAGSDVKVVTVIGFPLGANKTEVKAFEASCAVADGADEVDMVLNVSALKDKNYEYVREDIKAVKIASKDAPLKVILETDLLTKEEIKKACEICIEAHADFVKTSTGFVKNGVGAKVEDVKINQIAPPLLSDENTLALALGEEEIANLAKSKAKAALVPLGVQIDGLTTIEVERPRLAMMKLISMFYEEPHVNSGIHPTATVHPSAKIGQNVSLGANVVIGENAQVGDNTKILANCYIGNNAQIGPNVVVCRDAVIGDNTKVLANTYIGSGAKIGKNCLFHPGVNIGDRVKIGNDVILHHGVSLGADGFSFVTENPNNIEQARKDGEIRDNDVEQVIFKIPSIGSVVIGNNVEIGANTAIDRGTIENTVVGDNTKIDDLVMIGHNCRIGKGCMIVSQVGIAGSCVIGDRVVIAGQAGLADHISIGDDTIIAAQAGVTKSFPAKSIVVGAPAVPRKEFIKQLKIVKDAGDLIAKFKKYEPLLKTFEESVKEG